MELFVATNCLFTQKQENVCTLLRWINLGTCKVLHNLCMKGSYVFVLFVTLRSPNPQDFLSHS
jgi:hypothetical protein